MFKKLLKHIKRRDFFGILIDIIAVVLIWRGIWNLLDLYLFPNNPLTSNLISIAIGLVFVWLDDKKLDELK